MLLMYQKRGFLLQKCDKEKKRKVNIQQQQHACEEPKEEPQNLDEEREQWKDALLADEDWQATIVRYSGKAQPSCNMLGKP